MTNHYGDGREFEWLIQKDLERRGFVTIRAAGSKGAAKVDIIAVDPLGVHLWVQAKMKGAISPAEWNTLRMCAGWARATPLVAHQGPRGIAVIYTELLGENIPRTRNKPSRLYTFADVDTMNRTLDPDNEE